MTTRGEYKSAGTLLDLMLVGGWSVEGGVTWGNEKEYRPEIANKLNKCSTCCIREHTTIRHILNLVDAGIKYRSYRMY